jgi:beta-glucosidase
VTVSRDERWGRAYESFSEDPALVAELGEAAVRGFQGSSLADPKSLLACAKHYAGDGGTAMGTGLALSYDASRKGLDQGDTRVDEATLRKIHLPGYVTAIKAGVGSIMPSYSSWNGEKCSGSKRLLTDILKGELGFEGFLISDWMAIDQLPGDYKSDVRQSVNAGMDMVMVPHRYREFISTLKALVEEGAVPMARIDDAVKRILRVKLAMGLLDEGRSPLADPDLARTFGSAEHRAVARRAVRESLVVLKNDGKVLPLAKTAPRIHVSGKSAKDIGNQCGGWTVSWQGMSGALVPGTTILDAIRGAAGKTTHVTFTRDGKEAAGATVGVVVVGETPYAEMRGDREDLALAKDDIDVIAAVKKAGVPVVTVVISGRPVILGEALNLSDAIVAAWLPGTEGDGVADVLFGDYKPAGKLSFSWPRSMTQVPINVGDQPYDPLFPYGFGLTY